MGILINCARFLKACPVRGRVLMLGRQNLYVDADDLSRLCPGLAPSEYAEPLLTYLGAEKVDSMDASAYEGATIIHDLNQPVPDSLCGQFDTVIDAGTLEHVFNFPVALASCMRMLRVGGHLIIHNGCNNLCGHGFYQFSPELFFRALSPANGFEVLRCVIHEDYAAAPWYEVTDPDKAGKRVEFINSMPTMLLVLARKVAEIEPFQNAPQQSDYSRLWTKDTRKAALPVKPSRLHRMLARLLRPVRLWQFRRRLLRQTGLNQSVYTKVTHTSPE